MLLLKNGKILENGVLVNKDILIKYNQEVVNEN